MTPTSPGPHVRFSLPRRNSIFPETTQQTCSRGQGTRVRVTDARALRLMRRLGASVSWPVPRTPLEYRERESYDQPRVSGGSSLCLSPSKGVGRYEVHVLARRRLPRLRLSVRRACPKRLHQDRPAFALGAQ